MNRRVLTVIVCVMAVLCVWPSFTNADSSWVYFSESDHYYKRFDTLMSWNDAKTYAENVGGYLATVTSPSENDFLWNTLVLNLLDPSLNSPWLGGFQPPGTPEPDMGWQWVTGEEWNFTNWAASQPDDAWGGQDYLKFADGGRWDDYDHPDGVTATLIVESTTPEPATIALLGLGGLLLRRRKRRAKVN